MKLGIRLETLGLPLRRALSEAAQLGVAGVQVDAVGDLHPDRLSQTGRRGFRHLLRSENLELSALGCPLRRGLDVAEDQQSRIEYVRKVMMLAFDLGPRVVIVDMPAIPEESDPLRGRRLREALADLGLHGDRIGARLALEVGLDRPDLLAAYLDGISTGALGVNFDPANLMLNGHDPMAGVTALGRRIIHVHARDVRRAGAGRAAQETAIGAGDLEWMSFVAGLDAIEYRGWIVVERETGPDRRGDVTAGVAFLRRFMR